MNQMSAFKHDTADREYTETGNSEFFRFRTWLNKDSATDTPMWLKQQEKSFVLLLLLSRRIKSQKLNLKHGGTALGHPVLMFSYTKGVNGRIFIQAET